MVVPVRHIWPCCQAGTRRFKLQQKMLPSSRCQPILCISLAQSLRNGDGGLQWYRWATGRTFQDFEHVQHAWPQPYCLTIRRPRFAIFSWHQPLRSPLSLCPRLVGHVFVCFYVLLYVLSAKHLRILRYLTILNACWEGFRPRSFLKRPASIHRLLAQNCSYF